MTLKFTCRYCDYEIIAAFLKVDDMLRCPSCGSIIVVPYGAIATDEEPNLIEWSPPPGPRDEAIEAVLPDLPEPPQATPWGVTDVLKFVGLYMAGAISLSCVLGLIAAGIFLLANGSGHAVPFDWQEPYHSYFWTFVSVFFDTLSIGLIYYFVVGKHHNDFWESLGLDSVSKKQFLHYFLIALGIWVFVGLLGLGVHLSPLKDRIPTRLPIDEYWRNGYAVAILFTILALVAPIPEEIVHRGFIFKGFQNKLGTTWAAVIVTIIFVLMHGPQLAFSPFHLFNIAATAVVLIAIRIRTGSVTRCILVHFFYNLSLSIVKWTVVLIYGLDISK
jgi:membrane protease YdiL (CAAX protease family)